MPQLVFTVKPDLVNALAPILAKWLVRFSVGGVVAYVLVTWLAGIGVFEVYRPLLITAVVLIVLVFAILSIKFHLVRLHATRYLFYDTHVAVESGLFFKSRDSMPYKQISKITNSSSVWDRFSKASDLILRSARPDDLHDLRLRSVKNSSEVEHRIYRLLKEAKQEDHA